MERSPTVLQSTEEFVSDLFKKSLSGKFVYHNFRHTSETVKYCRQIGKEYHLDEEQMETLLLAAWMHDIGYKDAYIGHEARSENMAQSFLERQNYPSERLEKVTQLIRSTAYNPSNPPADLLEEIIHDADLINIGRKAFFERADLLRLEWEMNLNKKFSDYDWERTQLEFLASTNFYTSYCQKEYGSQREENIREQSKRVKKSGKRKDKDKDKEREKEKKALEKQEKNKEKESKPGRGIETMYRTTYRNHINLSAIADSKANMMISINTIIMSIIITVTGGGLAMASTEVTENLRFIVPVGILLITSLLSVVFAVMSARPTVTSKNVNTEKIQQKKSSILFFGNFSNIPLPSFIEKMNTLMADKDMLYDNMTVDLYYLGKVLTRKYILLRLSYGIFMGGFILCVLAFIGVYIYTLNWPVA